VLGDDGGSGIAKRETRMVVVLLGPGVSAFLEMRMYLI
jgi:hypothetical protein